MAFFEFRRGLGVLFSIVAERATVESGESFMRGLGPGGGGPWRVASPVKGPRTKIEFGCARPGGREKRAANHARRRERSGTAKDAKNAKGGLRGGACGSLHC